MKRKYLAKITFHHTRIIRTARSKGAKAQSSHKCESGYFSRPSGEHTKVNIKMRKIFDNSGIKEKLLTFCVLFRLTIQQLLFKSSRWWFVEICDKSFHSTSTSSPLVPPLRHDSNVKTRSECVFFTLVVPFPSQSAYGCLPSVLWALRCVNCCIVVD